MLFRSDTTPKFPFGCIIYTFSPLITVSLINSHSVFPTVVVLWDMEAPVLVKKSEENVPENAFIWSIKNIYPAVKVPNSANAITTNFFFHIILFPSFSISTKVDFKK